MSSYALDYLVWKLSTTTQTETGNIDYRGAHIHYVAYGQGEPVLLLHGGLSNKLSWFSQIPWLVASGRRVVLVDTRGHGSSTAGNTKLSYQIFAEDTLQVLDRLGIQRTDIIDIEFFQPVAILAKCAEQFWIITHRLKSGR